MPTRIVVGVAVFEGLPEAIFSGIKQTLQGYDSEASIGSGPIPIEPADGTGWKLDLTEEYCITQPV